MVIYAIEAGVLHLRWLGLYTNRQTAFHGFRDLPVCNLVSCVPIVFCCSALILDSCLTRITGDISPGLCVGVFLLLDELPKQG
jgi:hypothetical protein